MTGIAEPVAPPPRMPLSRRIAKEWLWFLGSIAVSAAMYPALSDDSYSGPTISTGAAIGGLMLYPGIVLVRFTAWSVRTIRGDARIFKTKPTTPANAVIYLLAALLFGVLGAIASGFNIATAEGLGAALGGGPLFGLVIAGVRSLFRPTNFPRWIFWTSLAAWVINSAARR